MLSVLALAAIVSVIGFLVADALAGSATRTSATVSLRMTRLGPILVNARGHTLYLFRKDSNGGSACNASCAKFWPPLLSSGKPTAGSGVKTSLLAMTARKNGSPQVTYNRHPLYTFALDKQAGHTNGEGNLAFGAKWYAVSASGNAVVKATGTPTTSTPTTTTNPYPTTTSPYP